MRPQEWSTVLFLAASIIIRLWTGRLRRAGVWGERWRLPGNAGREAANVQVALWERNFDLVLTQDAMVSGQQFISYFESIVHLGDVGSDKQIECAIPEGFKGYRRRRFIQDLRVLLSQS